MPPAFVNWHGLPSKRGAYPFGNTSANQGCLRSDWRCHGKFWSRSFGGTRSEVIARQANQLWRMGSVANELGQRPAHGLHRRNPTIEPWPRAAPMMSLACRHSAVGFAGVILALALGLVAPSLARAGCGDYVRINGAPHHGNS